MNKEAPNWLKVIENKISEIKLEAASLEASGEVLSVEEDVISVYGLKNVFMGEVVAFECGTRGICFNIQDDSVGVIALSDSSKVKAGYSVKRTGSILTVKSGEGVLGRTLNGLGIPIDGEGELLNTNEVPVERPAPKILSRQSVEEPLYTGIKVIDSLVPIGRGQRQLIIGDRQSGKTTIAIDTILNQAKINDTLTNDKEKVYCVYVAIGQKNSSVANIVRLLEENDAMKYTCIVSASAASTAAEQYLAPYVGCAIAEYFRDSGRHAVVFYDDLSKHAMAYRQISLLLRRPPGREAYPSDIFFLHSRLLERAAKLNAANGSGSLTALPIVETLDGDISAYIPTNVISITDGQLFLDTSLFFQGIKPAVSVGLSVSRVGSSAQTKAMKKVSSSLKLDLSQYYELVKFSQFSSDLPAHTMRIMTNGAKLIQTLIQKAHRTYNMFQELLILYAASKGFLEGIETKDVQRYEQELSDYATKYYIGLESTIISSGELNAESVAAIEDLLNKFNKLFKENIADA